MSFKRTTIGAPRGAIAEDGTPTEVPVISPIERMRPHPNDNRPYTHRARLYLLSGTHDQRQETNGSTGENSYTPIKTQPVAWFHECNMGPRQEEFLDIVENLHQGMLPTASLNINSKGKALNAKAQAALDTVLKDFDIEINTEVEMTKVVDDADINYTSVTPVPLVNRYFYNRRGERNNTFAKYDSELFHYGSPAYPARNNRAATPGRLGFFDELVAEGICVRPEKGIGSDGWNGWFVASDGNSNNTDDSNADSWLEGAQQPTRS